MDNNFKRTLSDFLFEEEANISRKKIVTVGTLMALAAIMFATDVLAKHRSHSSHSSHRSHSSHSSHSSHTSSSHSSHGSHSSSTHNSHSNHASHSSHSNSITDHVSHASHASASATHVSHSSSVGGSMNYPAHSNVGTSSGIEYTPNAETTLPNASGTGGFVDIRRPLTPPESPKMVDVEVE